MSLTISLSLPVSDISLLCKWEKSSVEFSFQSATTEGQVASTQRSYAHRFEIHSLSDGFGVWVCELKNKEEGEERWDK